MHHPDSARRLARAALALSVLTLAACASAPRPPVPAPELLAAACGDLSRHIIPASALALPAGPARITAAELVQASPGREANGAWTPALPQFCKVTGTIASRDPAAQAIQFQLNLPTTWNGKALQYGGGGFNGVLINGLAPLRDAAPSDPLPITRGYLTFGHDSGHQAASFPPGEPGAFARNDEMLENFAFASYKKVRDLAVHVASAYYGQAPKRMYYFGGSEGGREGLAMAQRFPADYDGIVSVVPVIHWTGLFHAFVRAQVQQLEGGWLPLHKVALVARIVGQACDGLDGAPDGVINNPLACQSRVDLRPLRCPDGADSGPMCLSDAQLGVLTTLASPYRFSFPLANGLTEYPGWLWGHEDSLDGPSAVSLVRWVTGSVAPAAPPDAARHATQWIYGSNWIRHAIVRDAGFDVRRYRPEDFQARVQATSALMDATDPDLSAFFARGGRIILRENAGDRAQSPLMGIRYHEAVVARLGQAATDRGMRLYLSPASTHTGNARSVGRGLPVPTMLDLLDPLDQWVEQGRAPADALVQTVQAPLPPFAVQGERPLCRYPAYPRYVSGDPARAASWACRTDAH